MSEDIYTERLEAVLKTMRSQWLAWLRRRHAALAARHEDIVQDAVLDLFKYLKESENRGLSDDEIQRIGFTILRRRVADEFRTRLRTWHASPSLDQIPEKADGVDLEKAEEFERLLGIVLTLLAPLDRASRNLIVRGEAGDDTALSDAERQKLLRLRADLRRELIERFNLDVKSLLRD